MPRYKGGAIIRHILIRIRAVIALSFAFSALASLFSFPMVHASGATLYVSPPNGNFVVDSTFDVSFLVNTGGESINAVSLDISFPTDLLQVVKPVAGSSFIAIWIAQPSFSNTDGTIHLEGGAPQPGLNSSAGTIMGVTFRARAAGSAKIKIADGAKVLANDGSGTNIFSTKNDATITITPKPPQGATLSSSTHPDQNTWYSNATPVFSWESAPKASAISWSYDQNLSTEPDTKAEEFSPTITTKADQDGRWYFHLRVQANGVWSGTNHYLTNIDTTAPAKFTPVIDPNHSTSQQKPVVTFRTTDALSGLDHYDLKVDATSGTENASTFFTEQQSPYVLPQLKGGKHQVTVRAYDKAGNMTEGQATVDVISLPSPTNPFLAALLANEGIYIAIIGLLLLALAILLILYFHHRPLHTMVGINTPPPPPLPSKTLDQVYDHPPPTN